MPTHLLQIAKKLAHDAGRTALKMQKKGFKTQSKDGRFDLVTDADKAVETFIVKAIRDHFPDHAIISEESGEMGSGSGSVGDGPAKDAEYKWFIDPIDGTTNFAHGLPFFAISIGISHKGKPMIGVVEIPAFGETFWAMEGKGAHLENHKIHVSKTSEMKNALMATGFPYAREGQRYEMNMKLWDYFYQHCHGVRRLGVASIDLCYTAAGRFDAYWEFDLKPWDIAAGKIIVEEAGGTVTNMDGTTLSPKRGALLATNSLLHEQMLQSLKRLGADQV